MLFHPQRQTEIALVHAQMIRLTVMCAFVHPTLDTPQLTFLASHLTQLDVTPQVHDAILKVTFQFVDARVVPASSSGCLESRHVLVQPFAYVGNPQIHDVVQVLCQSRNSFLFGDVLARYMAIPSREKGRKHAFARHRLITAAATANEELVRYIRQVDWRVCIQVLHRRGQHCSQYDRSNLTLRGSCFGSISTYPKASALVRSVEINCAR